MTEASSTPKPVVLVILDGWGERHEIEHNAIASAKTPNWDRLVKQYPLGNINASELHVGLPTGQMGNSEVGHMNIGSGRVVMQDLPRIDEAVEKQTLGEKPSFKDFCANVKSKTVHLMGLVSDGGVHAHVDHMGACAKLLATEGFTVHIHAMLDGRDTPPKSAEIYIKQLEKAIFDLKNVKIATLSGRYYAMDRDKRWDRVEKAYQTIVLGAGEGFSTPLEALQASYDNNINDEFVLPCTIGDYAGVKEGDGLMMTNFRADRAREILSACLNPAFDGFARKLPGFSAALGMAEYSSELNPFIPAIFPPESPENIFGQVISDAGLKQLRIAETEKYAHVTFFFNCGREEPYAGEERILIPSPNVATYDLKPEMSAPEVTDALVDAIKAERFDVIVVNYANTDMVGHTGNIEAARKAVETVDTCLGRVVEATLEKDGALFITADHGNAEQMFNQQTGQAHTAHTLNLVPALIISNALKDKNVPIPEGKLGDIAPTLLQLLGLPQPKEMTGRSLLAQTQLNRHAS